MPAAFCLFVLAAVLAVPATPQAFTTTSNVKIPIGIVVSVPCAGEDAALSGSLHALFHVTADPSGGFHINSHFQPQGVSGTGLSSGLKYQGTGVTRFGFNSSAPLPFNFTFINNFRIIGQGPGNNLTVHQSLHVTVNANGEVTAFADNFRVACK